VYAVIDDSGQQFRVSEGDVLDVDRRELADDAKEVVFDRVLLVNDDDKVKVGTPHVRGAKVTAELLDADAKGPKLYIHRWRRRKNSRRRTGHRQKLLRVRVKKITKGR
jgi:large subunit ribosomal protein L21